MPISLGALRSRASVLCGILFTLSTYPLSACVHVGVFHGSLLCVCVCVCVFIYSGLQIRVFSASSSNKHALQAPLQDSKHTSSCFANVPYFHSPLPWDLSVS